MPDEQKSDTQGTQSSSSQQQESPRQDLPERDPQTYRKSEDYSSVHKRDEEHRTGKE